MKTNNRSIPYDTNMLLLVNSSRLGMMYEVHRFMEYRIDLDLETDCDGFDFVLKNPNGIYTGLFSKFDPVDIRIQDNKILKGFVDCVEYSWDDNNSSIHITGRDIVSTLVDNDAIPGTKLSIKPSTYIKDKCTEYGIKTSLDMTLPVINKLIIGTGESEISIMNNLIIESRKRMWASYDTLYMGDWNDKAKPTYYFTRGMTGKNIGIPIKSLSLKEDGTDMKSEVKIYGSMADGSEKVVGTAINDYMISKGIKKRKVDRSYNNDSTSKYSSNALRDVRDSFKDNIILEIKIKGTNFVVPNTTAQVIDSVTKINAVFFIKSVSHTKDINSGSNTIIRMIPGDTAFNVLWKGQGTKKDGGITGTPKMTLDELIKSRKG